MTTALHIVQQYQQSLGNGTDAWQHLLAENVEFQGPVDTVKGREANIEFPGSQKLPASPPSR